MSTRTLIFDNGGYTIKAGFASPNPHYEDCHLIPNCIARSRDRRSLVATQIESCRDFGGMAFRRPVEKGYLVNWEAEKEIWDRTLLEETSVVNVRVLVGWEEGRVGANGGTVRSEGNTVCPDGGTEYAVIAAE